MIDLLLNEALEAAEVLDSCYGGMASVGIKYDPYDGQWVAKANWSDGTAISAYSIFPDLYVELLIESLRTYNENRI